MLIGRQKRLGPRRELGFWFVCGLLFIVAVALRWARLDLMSFRFDQAAVCQRALEMSSGQFALTGIVNSLGFRNAPGYVWSLLPVFLFTCSPLVVAAWHGLLCATMVFPMALVGRRVHGEAAGWLPAILVAVLPAMVFAGRNLWAQYLLAPLAAWALWALFCALDAQRELKVRQRFGAAALALAAWATSVHYGAAPGLIIIAAVLFGQFRRTGVRANIIMLIPAVIVLVTILPSFADFVYRQSNPMPKPEYVLKFEAQRPPPLPWWARISEAASASVVYRSGDTMVDVPRVLPGGGLALLRVFDGIVTALIFAGLVFSVGRLLWRKGELSAQFKAFLAVLLLWIALPVLIGGIFLKWVQPSYFTASLPAALLTVLFLPQISRGKAAAGLRYLSGSLAALLLVGGVFLSGSLLQKISRLEIVPGGYYIPFKWQSMSASFIHEHRVPGENVQHLAGPIFEESIRYLVECEGDTDKSDSVESQYALVQDMEFVRDAPEQLEFLRESGAVEIGPTLVKVLPSRGAAAIFERQYYALPVR